MSIEADAKALLNAYKYADPIVPLVRTYRGITIKTIRPIACDHFLNTIVACCGTYDENFKKIIPNITLEDLCSTILRLIPSRIDECIRRVSPKSKSHKFSSRRRILISKEHQEIISWLYNINLDWIYKRNPTSKIASTLYEILKFQLTTPITSNTDATIVALIESTYHKHIEGTLT